jgi:hypothetical protein
MVRPAIKAPREQAALLSHAALRIRLRRASSELAPRGIRGFHVTPLAVPGIAWLIRLCWFSARTGSTPREFPWWPFATDHVSGIYWALMLRGVVVWPVIGCRLR